MEEKQFLFEWRDAIKGEDGPESPITRLVLLMLSLHMDLNGDSCFPSQRLLSRETGLSLPTVNKHLKEAEQDKWIIRKTLNAGGQGYKRHAYSPIIPDNLLKQVKHVNTKNLLKQVKHVDEKLVKADTELVKADTDNLLKQVKLSPSVSTSKSSSADAPALSKAEKRAGGNRTGRAVSGQSPQTPPMLKNLPSIKAGETTNVVSIPAYLKYKQGRPNFLKEEIEQGSMVKIKADIKTISDKLYLDKKWLKVYEFIQKMLQNKFHSRAILHALNQACSKQEIGNHWAYCEKIVRVESPNYNAADYGKVNDFRGSDDKPIYRYIDEVMGASQTFVPVEEAQKRIGQIVDCLRAVEG